MQGEISRDLFNQKTSKFILHLVPIEKEALLGRKNILNSINWLSEFGQRWTSHSSACSPSLCEVRSTRFIGRRLVFSSTHGVLSAFTSNPWRSCSFQRTAAKNHYWAFANLANASSGRRSEEAFPRLVNAKNRLTKRCSPKSNRSSDPSLKDNKKAIKPMG